MGSKLFLYAVLGTLGVVLTGSLHKSAALARGGSAVAESLGGRLLNPNTTHPDERKLRNVIEEMAIAAGVPVPKVYVLDDESGINAFAAGHTPGDAAIGVFFGRLIQAALSRQCEFLADASAVQFTRNPAGLSRALQKIGVAGSQVESAHAGEASHMFFGNGLGKPFLGALATHPPLDARIRAIDPGWDGKFRSANANANANANTRQTESPRETSGTEASRSPFPGIPGIPGAWAGVAGFATPGVPAGAVLPDLGKPTPLHLRYAEALRDSFPDTVQSAARDPLEATALIYAMLLSPDPDLRAKEVRELSGQAAPAIGEMTAAL